MKTNIEPIVMPNQIDPGTSIDIYVGREWESGWTLVRPAVRVHEPDGDHYAYTVQQYSLGRRLVPVAFVRRSKEGSK